jgi:transcriptional regulator with XRE-family HTH domain
MHIGKKIKLARVSKGFTQQDLAEMINKTRPLVSHIELTGKVSAYTLNKIGKALTIDFNNMEQIFAEDPKGHYPGNKQDVETMKIEIDRLKKEIEILHELVNSQKEVIRALKENPGKRKYK